MVSPELVRRRRDSIQVQEEQQFEDNWTKWFPEPAEMIVEDGCTQEGNGIYSSDNCVAILSDFHHHLDYSALIEIWREIQSKAPNLIQDILKALPKEVRTYLLENDQNRTPYFDDSR